MIEFIALLSNVLVSRHVRFASRPANTNQTKWRHDHRFSVKTRDMANGRVAVAGHGDLGPNFLGFAARRIWIEGQERKGVYIRF